MNDFIWIGFSLGSSIFLSLFLSVFNSALPPILIFPFPKSAFTSPLRPAASEPNALATSCPPILALGPWILTEGDWIVTSLLDDFFLKTEASGLFALLPTIKGLCGSPEIKAPIRGGWSLILVSKSIFGGSKDKSIGKINMGIGNKEHLSITDFQKKEIRSHFAFIYSKKKIMHIKVI